MDIGHVVVATDLNKTSRPTLRDVPTKHNGGAYRTGMDWLFCSNNTTKQKYKCLCLPSDVRTAKIKNAGVPEDATNTPARRGDGNVPP